MQINLFNEWFSNPKCYYDIFGITLFGIILIGFIIDLESYLTVSFCFMNFTVQIDFD